MALYVVTAESTEDAALSDTIAHAPRDARAPADLAATADDPLLESLASLARQLGRPTSHTALTAGLPLTEGRLSPELLPRAAARAGLASRLVRRRLERIAADELPCILLLDDGDACVAIRRGAAGLVGTRPSTGEAEVALDGQELGRRYNGVVLAAAPSAEPISDDETTVRPASGHWFWSVLRRQWPVYAEVALAAVLINAFALASPLFVMNVYDRVVPNAATATLWVLTLGALIVFGFDLVLKILRGYFVDVAGRAADVRIAASVFEHVLGMRMAARPASAGAFANHLRELESLRDFFSSATVTALVDVPFVLMFLVVLWALGGPVALVPAIAVPVVLLIGLLLQLPIDRAVRRTFAAAARKHGILVEAVSGLETVKTVGAEGRLQARYERAAAVTADGGSISRLMSSVTVNVAALAGNLVTVGAVVVGVHEIIAGRLTTGALVACTILAGRAMAPLSQVASILTRWHQARAAYTTLDAIMQMPVERPPARRFVHRAAIRGELNLDAVTFTYPGQRQPALREVSLRIAAGERVALVGRIGSGKSTVSRLILGLYEPSEGAVMVDGFDVRHLDPAQLRRAIGCVPQDVVLFQGSLRDNIAFGAEAAEDEAILRAAAIAGVDAFAGRHAQGYDMQVGERGAALSGGQRQALAVARALIHEPDILLFDEPTSAMDNGAEARLKASLTGYLEGGRTLLLVTHRASLLSLVDRVVVLDGGRIVADGPRDTILQRLASGRIRGEA